MGYKDIFPSEFVLSEAAHQLRLYQESQQQKSTYPFRGLERPSAMLPLRSSPIEATTPSKSTRRTVRVTGG
jgi:hypothetical protein